MRKITLTITLFFLFFAQAVLSQTIKYVSVNGSGNKDGSSWSNASDNLQKMISLSSGETEIWIAKGKYVPRSAPAPNDNPQDRNNTFGLKKDVKLYGGFSGTETSTEQRDIVANETILSGDLGGGNYAYHVVFIHAFADTDKYYLNGLTISEGKSDVLDYYNISEEVGSTKSTNEQLEDKYPDWFVSMTESPYYEMASIGLQLLGEDELPGVLSIPGGDARWVTISKTSYPQSNGAGIYNVLGDLTIENVTLKNNTGVFGAAISVEFGKTTVVNSTFTDNKTTNNAGAIVSTESSLTIKGGIFNNNSSLLGGAIVEVDGKSLNISNVTFTNNKAISDETNTGFGGAIYFEKVDTADSSIRTIDNCTFTNNSAPIAGAIYVGENISNLKITKSKFKTNKALLVATSTLADGGGAIKLQKVIKAEITGNSFNDNSASKGIGGACVLDETDGVTFSDNILSGNTSLSGGALYLLNNKSTTTINRNEFDKNSVTYTSDFSSSGVGGAVASFNDNNVQISDKNTFTDNTAQNGGAIYFVTSAVNSTINDNTFKANSSEKFGGVIFASTPNAAVTGKLTLTNNNFENNNAIERGGGILLTNKITTDIHDNIFIGNKSYIGAVLDILSSAETQFYNNTVKGNVGTTNSLGSSSGIITTVNGVSKLYNNVFTGNESFTAVFYDNSTVDFVNNTVWNEKSRYGIYMISSKIKLYNNILEQLSGTATSVDVKNNSFRYDNTNYVAKNNNILETNLYFADEAKSNFYLTGCSPLLNKGSNSLYSSDYSTTDFSGKNRKVETIDIGAYENTLGVSGKTMPTVVAIQTFCNQVIVNDLKATGSNVKWYSQALGGSPLANNTALISGNTYYASQTIDGCESDRASVAVSISSTVAPTAQSPQNFIIGQQGVNIVVNGSNLKWYTQEEGGVASTAFPSLNLSSENSATYWVSQTNANNCESTRTKIVVNVTKIPLTVKAIDQTKIFDGNVYGNGNFKVTYSGFESGDNESNSISGSLSFSGDATTATEPGVYKIIPQGISSSKYTVLFEEETLEIKSNLNLTDNVLYVRQGVNGDGTSWSSPLSSLEVALTKATNINSVHTNDSDPKKVKKIYVAKGTYELASGKSFIMPKNIEIYGGFDPDNAVTNLTHQRITDNTNGGSILKGNGASVIKNDDNGLTANAVLNGFTITNGNTTNGGGIYNKKVAPKFENCIIKSNIATANGGAIYNESANTTWVNCLIVSNNAQKGASIYNDASLPTLLNNTIADNTGTHGATMYNTNGSNLSIVNTISVKNSSDIVNEASTANYENSLIQGINGITKTTSVFDSNYVLLTASPALNVGNNNPANLVLPAKDLKGKSRIIDTKVDLGVFERNKTQTIAASDITKKYGDEPFTHGTASSGLPLEYISSSNNAVAKIEEGKIKVVGVGTTTITVSQPGNDTEYDAASATFILTAGKRTLTVSADNKVKLYDGSKFTGFTVSYSGFVFDDTPDNSLSGNLTYSGTATTATTISSGTPYTIIPSGYTSSNYEITYANGGLTIDPNITLTDGTIYVKKGATGNGSSWANALGEVSDALTIAKSLNSSSTPGVTKATKIYVSKGSYTPKYSARDNANFVDEGKDNSFLLVNDVKFYGGFDGNIVGESLVNRDVQKNKTILDGSNVINHIITVSNAMGDNEVNGFTILKGAASDLGTNDAGSVTVNGKPINRTYGGGIRVHSSNVSIKNCIISENSSGLLAGGIYISDQSTVSIYNTLFYGNFAKHYAANASSILIDNANVKIVNATFGDANSGDGIVYRSHISTTGLSTLEVSNSIFRDNLYNKDINRTSGTVTIKNSLLSKAQTDSQYSSMTLANNIYAQAADFIDVNANNYALNTSSVAVDKGDNTLYNSAIGGNKDLAGLDRVKINSIDMGCYETRIAQTITATDITKTYGDSDFIHPSASITTNFPLTYTKSSNVNVASIKEGKIHVLNPGTTTITITQVGDKDYAPLEKTFVLTVAKATLTVKANDKSKFANNVAFPNAAYDVSYTGFVNGDDSSKLTGSIQYSGSAIGKTEIGIYTDGIIPSGLSSSYYDFVYQNGTLKIVPNTTLTNNTLYVKQDAVGGNGSSWQLALNDLSLALRYATILNNETPNTVNKIYVAKGTYTPKYSARDNSNFIDEGRDNSFLVLDGVKLYGGFDGNIADESINDRHIQENKTILDGKSIINHIITVANATANNEIDGFTISKGTAANGGSGSEGSVTVNGKSITRQYGGGISVLSSNLTIKNCVITENSSGVQAGGIYITDLSNVSIYNTLFYGNSSYHYGANGSSIVINNANAKIVNTTFGDAVENSSHITTSGSSSLEVFNAVFRDNTNNNDINRTAGTVIIKNSLLSKAESKYSNMTLANNSYAKPADFMDVSANNFALKATSAAINKGDNTLYNSDIAGNKDIANTIRILGEKIDMGCYESKLIQTIDVTDITKKYTDADFVVGTASSGLLPLTYSSDNKTVAYITKDNKIDIVGVGQTTITVAQNGNETYASASKSFILTVEKGDISTTLNPETYTYDGSKKYLNINDLPTGTTVSYEGNGQINAGEYTVKANISGGQYYNDIIVSNTLKINKTELSGISFPEKTFTYDGFDKHPEVSGTLPEGVNVVYSNTQKDAGYYDNVKATLSGSNYNVLELTTSMTIKKADLSDAISLLEKEEVYDGTPKKLSLDSELPKGVTTKYTNNDNINVGSYDVRVKIDGGKNYNDKELIAKLIISKGDLDTNVVLTHDTYIYDGNEKSLTINGVLPDQVTVSFTNNNKVDVGSYKVYATLSKPNYNDKIIESELIIEPKSLNVIAQGEISKVYNANTIIALNADNFALEGFVNDDDVQLNNPVAAELDNKNVGVNKAVTINALKLYGADAKNYKLSATSLVANIAKVTPKKLDVSLKGSVTKIFDATTKAVLSTSNFDITGIVENETIAINTPLEGEYDSKDVGKNKIITVSNLNVTGDDASNYILNSQTVAGQIGEITAKAITVTADAKTKVYGAEDPILTYSVSPSLETGDTFTGSLSRATGNSVGTYAIASSLNNDNYTITYTPADLTITAKAITVTADAKTKVYGAAEPVLTYSVSPSLVGTDTFEGSLSRATGNSVGTYAIASSLNNTNYAITYTPANFTITAKAIAVTAAAKSKTYGDADPALTYTFAPALVTGDSFSGSLSRTAGENVGTYAINQNTLVLSGNYTLNYTSADLTIGKKTVTLTAIAKSKIYGDADPALTYTFAPALVREDSFSGSLSRTAGEDVGTYAINQNTLALSGNYTLNYTAADLTIGKKTVTLTAIAKSKIYGDADPALTYTFAPALVREDSFSGSLSRTAGEDVGTYAINQNTLALSGNYTLNYTAADLTIGKKTVTVTAAAKSKTYGDADPSLTYTFAPALVTGDSFSGSLSRAVGETEGAYAINQNILALSGNYTLNYISADLIIGKKTITVTAAAKSKTYGDADPSLTYTFAPALVTGDSFSGSLSRAVGETEGAYAINQNTLALSGNYTLNYISADLIIGKKTITVTAAAKSKTYGDADPTLTYTFAPALVTGDSFSGSLSRAVGETVGTYAINQNTLVLSGNYTLYYTSADLTIGAKTIAVTAAAKSKTYGDADPSLTYTFAPALVTGDSFSGSLSRAVGETVGTYAINQNTLVLSGNYTLNYTSADLTIGKKTIAVTAAAKSKTYGDADPSLTYTFAPALVTGDSFSGSLSRTAGETVGTYAINQNTLALNDNYTLNYTAADLTIGKKTVTLTAIAKSKTYGDADPALTYTFAPALVTGDSFSGSLSRATGENVDDYEINKGSLSAGSNYTITYVGATFSITKADQQITWNQTLGSGCDGETTTMLTATSSSGLPVSYSSSNTNIATVSNGSLVFENYGSANITASQTGNNNYNAAPVMTLPVVNSQPNLIRKQFEDVLFFDNSSKSFNSYSWYKNGVLVPGQTSQYFKDNGTLNGTYYAIATKLDGTLITTCSLTLFPTVEEEYIKLVPNPVKPYANYELLTNVSSSRIQNARVEVYSVAGLLMENKTFSQSTVTLKAPAVEGIYIVKMTLANGKYFTKNILVKN